jgi:hypothetical protein
VGEQRPRCGTVSTRSRSLTVTFLLRFHRHMVPMEVWPHLRQALRALDAVQAILEGRDGD